MLVPVNVVVRLQYPSVSGVRFTVVPMKGTEFTRYSAVVPVLIAGASPRMPLSGGNTTSFTGPSATSLAFVTATSSAPPYTAVVVQYWSVEKTRALFENPVFGWSPKHVPPSDVGMA